MKIFVHFSLFLLAICVLTACSDNKPQSRPKSTAHLVDIFKTEISPLVSEHEFSGVLEAVSRVQIFSETEGKILQLEVHPGDVVEKGQLLVKLDDSIILAQLSKAKASAKQAALILKRQLTLQKKRLASDEAITAAKTALEVAKAEQHLQVLKLRQTNVVAPFSGYISERLKEPGDVVSDYTHILTLVDKTSLKARIPVSEFLIATLQKGQAVTMRIDAIGNEVFPAKISRIYPVIDTATHQGTIEVALQPAPENALPGQFCRIYIKGKTTPRLNVPLIAVKQDFKGNFIYRIRDNKVERANVQTGIQIGDRIEIISGINVNDKVVTRGFIGLYPKKSIKIAGTYAVPDATKE